ncbi:MFS transporter [Granulibacter bethesdensis]|uniref:MFS transporter n=1 Tax=Granulibacter bethesdensis TaxID=364410 RepID=UPI00046D397D|nr:MFS transporter [Granulibacter bethesdensis]
MKLFLVLRHHRLACLWGGLSFSAIGDQLYLVALSWAAVQAFGANAGYLTAFQGFCILLAAFFVGPWADRKPQFRVMIGADLIRMVSLAALIGAWLIKGGVSAPFLLQAILLIALGQALFRPALQVVLPQLVPDQSELPAANALMDMTDRVARLLGPVMISVLAGFLPLVHFFTADAITFAISAIAVWLTGRNQVRQDAAPTHPLPTPWHAITANRGHPLLWYSFLIGPAICGAWYAIVYLALPLLITRLQPGATGLSSYGAVIAAYGVGNVLGMMIVGNRPLPALPACMMFGGTALVGAGLACMTLVALLAPPHWIAPGLMICAAIAGTGGPFEDIPIAILRQTALNAHDVPASARGFLISYNGGMLAGLAIAPSMLALTGPIGLIAGGGLSIVAIGMAGIVLYSHTPARQPDQLLQCSNTSTERPVT